MAFKVLLLVILSDLETFTWPQKISAWNFVHSWERVVNFSATHLTSFIFSWVELIKMDSWCCSFKCFLIVLSDLCIILSMAWGFHSYIFIYLFTLFFITSLFLNPPHKLLNPEIFFPCFWSPLVCRFDPSWKSRLAQIEYIFLVFDNCLLIAFCFLY